MRRFLLLTMILIFMSISAYADEPSGFFEDFDDESVFESWDGGFPEDGSCVVMNPYGAETDGLISHILSYNDAALFETGNIYKISFNVINLGAWEQRQTSSGIRFGGGVRNIVFEFGGISDEVQEVSQFFMVPEDGEYSFSIELRDGAPDIGFIVDDLVISKIDINPSNLTILGERSLTIPAAGTVDYSYRLGAYSSEGEIINILWDYSAMTAMDLPAGVSFSQEGNIVTVSEYCPDNAFFVLECTPPDFLSPEPVTAEITLSKNIFKNWDFSMGDDFWSADSYISVADGGDHISLYAGKPCQFGSCASLRPTYSAVLIENVMYVLRARVRADAAASYSVYSQNAAVSGDGRVEINVLDIYSGGWIDVVAAFRPEVSGAYDICVNFILPDSGFVDVASITLSPELPVETFITLHAPGNISIPQTRTVFPFGVFVRDQSGEVMDRRCTLEINPENDGVELTKNGIIVSPDAAVGKYEVTASMGGNSELIAKLNIELSNSNIGDGGFEVHKANEWWTAASPAILRIEGDAEERYARVIGDEDFAVVINNSYMHLYPGVPYAFRGDILYGEGHTVTAFVETVNGERVPVVQSLGGAGEIFELFQTDEELVGRLMLYISSDEGSVDIAFDDIELFSAVVSVSAPSIKGLIDSGATVEADFSFYNNMDSTNDSSDCIISWYMMDPKTKETTQIGSGRTLTIPGSAVGKYIYCDVTPVCRLTGLSGSTLRSIPVLMGAAVDDSIIVSQPPDISEKPVSERKMELRPVRLNKNSQTVMSFDDVDGHWAEGYIHSLFDAGVVLGKDERSFAPDEIITRGEFAALVCRSFELEGESCDFKDVESESWYYTCVGAVGAAKLMEGSGEGFAPEGCITREQLVSVLVRAYGSMGRSCGKNDLSRFYDNADISLWARENVAKGLNIGIVNGSPNSTFMPKAYATRAEACVMLSRLLNVLGSGE